MGKIHVQVWSAAGSARVTDMTNAGKRGKTCRVLRISGWYNWTCGAREVPESWHGRPYHNPEEWVRAAKAHQQTGRVLNYLVELAGQKYGWPAHHIVEGDFDAVAAEVAKILADADATEHVKIHAEEIRSIDAPKPPLVAGVPGEWSGGADEDGISLSDDKDSFNLPRMITSRQTKGAAYAIAAKVWPEVQKAKTFHEAGNILGAAGARLHYYCAMD